VTVNGASSPTIWRYPRRSNPGWTASPIRPDIIFGKHSRRDKPIAPASCPFRKFHPDWIFIVRQNHRIIESDVCDPARAWNVRRRPVPWASAPGYLVRDNDRAYGHVFTSRVRAMGIRDRPISPGSPWQNGCAERLIGTLRRECLDQIVIFGEMHLRRILSAYAAYHNQARTHLALQKDAPFHRVVQRSGAIVAIPILAGLHHQYVHLHSALPCNQNNVTMLHGRQGARGIGTRLRIADGTVPNGSRRIGLGHS
jgi:hypothetical protein